MLKKLEENVQFEIILPLILLFAPYFGEPGYQLFREYGKYYYAIVFIISMLAVLFQRIAFDKTFKPSNSGYVAYLIYAILLIITIVLQYFLSNLPFNDFALMMIVLLYPIALSFKGINDKTLFAIGNVSIVIWVLQILYSLTNPQNFNPNTYGFVIVFLVGLSLFSVANIRNIFIRILLLIGLFGVSYYPVEVIYVSHTQTIGLLLLLVAYLLKNLHHFKLLSKLVTSGFLIISVLLPIVGVILIQKGILDVGFISTRGDRWIRAFDSMMQVNIFECAPIDPGSHNGFFHLTINYSIFTGSLFIIGLQALSLYLITNMKDNKNTYLVLNLLCYYMLINWVESFYISLQDASFTAIMITLLVSRTKTKDKYISLEEYNINGRC